jgi:hypothetical protein
MKTNVRNGAFVLRTLAVDDGILHIGRDTTGTGKESFSYLPFNTNGDGEFLVIAETDKNGVVENISIQIPEHLLGMDDLNKREAIEINPSDIIIQDEPEGAE